MKLSKDSWHMKYWKLNYAEYEDSEVGSNFCDYFWELIIALLLTPITWISLIVNKLTNTTSSIWRNLLIGFVLNLILTVVIAFIVTVVQHPKMAGYTIISFIAIGLIVWLIWYLSQKWYPQSSLNRNLSEIGSITKEGFSSFKDSYCPRIEWKEEEDTH